MKQITQIFLDGEGPTLKSPKKNIQSKTGEKVKS